MNRVSPAHLVPTQSQNGTVIPIVFGRSVGWLHGAPPLQRGVGAVICSPHGFEELAGRRTLWSLADRLAAAGIPTLRFDYPGQADADGDVHDVDHVASWPAAIDAAIDRLRGETGVPKVLLIGLRLGALLAAGRAHRIDVAGLVLLAPPSSGRHYLREQAGLARLINPPGLDDEARAAGLSIGGYAIPDAVAAAIKTIDPRTGWSVRVPTLLVEAPGADCGLAAVARAAGTPLDQHSFGDYEQLFADRTQVPLPEATIGAVTRWAVAKGGRLVSAGSGALPGRPLLHGSGWTEEPIVIGTDKGMPGVLCTPAGRAFTGRIVIVLNAGGNSHTGWARQNVTLSRRLARQGISVLRFDMLGLGDAPEPTDGRSMCVYQRQMTHDVIRALDWVEARGFGPVTLMGSCSGAHTAFQVAADDRRVADLILVNLQLFVWKEGTSLTAATLDRPLGTYVEGGLSRDRLQRLLRGEIDFAGIAARLTRRLAGDAWRHLTRLVAGPGWVEQVFRTLSGRNARVLLVYSPRDGGRFELARYMGRNGQRALALPGVSMAVLAQADHNLTPDGARTELGDLVEAHLGLAGAATTKGRREIAQLGLGALSASAGRQT